MAVVGVLFVVVLSRLLPSRRAFDEIVADPREYTLELEVTPGGSIENKTIEAAGLRQLPGAFLAEVIRGNRIITAVAPDEVLRANDRLVFVGNVDSLKTLYGYQDLHPASDQIFKLDTPRHERCLVETVVSNTCPLMGNPSVKAGFGTDTMPWWSRSRATANACRAGSAISCCGRATRCWLKRVHPASEGQPRFLSGKRGW